MCKELLCTAVNIGEKNAVASYWYYDHNGKLGGVTYGNVDATDYSYNDLDLITEIWYAEYVRYKTHTAIASLRIITAEIARVQTKTRSDTEGITMTQTLGSIT